MWWFIEKIQLFFNSEPESDLEDVKKQKQSPIARILDDHYVQEVIEKARRRKDEYRRTRTR